MPGVPFVIHHGWVRRWKHSGVGLVVGSAHMPVLTLVDDFYPWCVQSAAWTSWSAISWRPWTAKAWPCSQRSAYGLQRTMMQGTRRYWRAVETIPRAKLMLVLGNFVGDGRDPMGAVVLHRTHKALSPWFALRPLLCLRSSSAQHRAWLFHTIVTAIVLWGLECAPTRLMDRNVLISMICMLLS